jgi:glycosyl transferase family 87/WD40 repeat protein
VTSDRKQTRIGSTQSTRHLSLNLIAEYLVLATLVGVFVWRGFLPAWKTLNTDFVDYYLAARLYAQGYPLEQVYDWTWIQRQKDHAGIERPIVAFALLTPFSLLPVLPFSSLPPLAAKRGWLVVNLVLLGFVGYLLHRMSRLGPRRVAMLVFLAMVPLRTNFLFGQEHVLLLFLFTVAAWLYLENRPLASGLALAVGGALKVHPSLFLLFFARKKQWRAAAGLVLGCIALWLLSARLFGFETLRTYLVEVLPWPLRGEGQDPYNIAWNSFSAVLHRLLIAEPELNPHPVAHLPALYAVLQPVFQGLIFVPCLWLMGSSRASLQREGLHWGTYVAMLLILSTNPASYDFNALILTAVLAVSYLIGAARAREAAAVVTLYALVSFPLSHWVRSSPSGWRTLLAVPRLWAMTGLWICLLVVLLRSTPEPIKVRLKPREAAAFAMIWLGLVVPAIALNLLHFRGQFANYATRLVVAPESYLDSEPVVFGEKVLFTMMTDDGYRTALFDGNSLTRLCFGSDSFRPATTPSSATGWVELASSRSRIVRFALNADGARQTVVEVEDAEKPAVSMDGQWLAFIRESKGRGALWVKQLKPRPGGAEAGSLERPVSGDDLDVLEAAFDPADRIVFAARQGGGPPALFHAGLEPIHVAKEAAPAPRRFPAVSPDGRWVAFSQRQHSNWQLWVQDRSTGAERRLTDSDCNSTAPAWYPDSKRLVYATDCGRGFGLTALCRIEVVR